MEVGTKTLRLKVMQSPKSFSNLICVKTLTIIIVTLSGIMS